MSLIFPLICLSHNLKLSMFLNMTHLMFLIECFFNCSTHFFQTRHQTRDRSGRHGTVPYGMACQPHSQSEWHLQPFTCPKHHHHFTQIWKDGRTFKHGDTDELYVANTTQRSMVAYKQNEHSATYVVPQTDQGHHTEHTAKTYWSEGLYKRVKVLACAKVKILVLVRSARLTNLYASFFIYTVVPKRDSLCLALLALHAAWARC